MNEGTNGNCLFCEKQTPPSHNYCSWNCHVEHAKSEGLQVVAPNGLPIVIITSDKVMEHEHADHADYKFPVDIEYVGVVDDDYMIDFEMLSGRMGSEDEVRRSLMETHALVYANDNVAVTMFEHCYAFWYTKSNKLVYGTLWKPNNWRLSEDSLFKVRTYAASKKINPRTSDEKAVVVNGEPEACGGIDHDHGRYVKKQHFCDFCECETCKDGESWLSHAQTIDGRWICEVCYDYEVCLDATAVIINGKKRSPNGPCDKPCEHRPKLTTGKWLKLNDK